MRMEEMRMEEMRLGRSASPKIRYDQRSLPRIHEIKIETHALSLQV